MVGAVPVGLVFTIVALVMVARYSGTASLSAATHAFARKVNLELGPGTERVVSARVARRERAAAVGAVVTVWGTMALLELGADVLEHTSFGMLIALAGFFVGRAVGLGLVAWYETTRPVVEHAPRIARASAPRHRDYVAGHERYGAWVVAALSVLLGLGVLLAQRTGALELDPMPWPAAVAAILVPTAAVVADELVARRLLARPQVAATTLELAWDDALRAATLRDMVTVPILAGLYLPILLLGMVGDRLRGGWLEDPVDRLVTGLLPVGVPVLLVVAVVSYALRPERHFRLRLWPATPLHGAAQDGVGR